ncbi:hypothetical protein diail_9961 [Diaporthe ilicicola]|nr:hypothetical protein diail_9961 [Diaporthe ilicicola]
MSHLAGDFHDKPNPEADAVSEAKDAEPEAFYAKFGTPTPQLVERLDSSALGPGVPQDRYAVAGAWMGCGSEKLTLASCAISLADFGEAYAVTGGTPQLTRQCHILLRLRPPAELGPASDVWTLAYAVFEITGAAPLFFVSFFIDEDLARWGVWAEGFDEAGERLDHADDDVRGPRGRRFELRSQKVRRESGMEE